MVFLCCCAFTSFVGAQNQPPVVTAVGYNSYCANTPINIAEQIAIVDPDNVTTTAIYVQISDGYLNGADVLALVGTHPNITAVWDSAQGELSLLGPATYAAFEAAVLDVVFSTTTYGGNRQFSITVGEPNFLPATQHYYEFVPAVGISWSAANAGANSKTYFGLQGYLVTLSSQEEADFAGAQAGGFGWIGATDAAVEGQWRWVTGPESGTLFWQGGPNGTAIGYANWNGGEPNDYGAGEDYAHIANPSVIRGGAPVGAWNDLPNAGGGGAYRAQGYVVEYGGMPGDPILQISASTTAVAKCAVVSNRKITKRIIK